MTNPTKMIIDTDPGIDDAMAILYAAQAPEIDLIGLTAVFGNVTVDQATRNALRLAEMARQEGAWLPPRPALPGVELRRSARSRGRRLIAVLTSDRLVGTALEKQRL